MAKKANKASNTENTGYEIIESTEVLQQEFNKAEGFVTKNKNLFIGAAAAVALIALAIFAYNYFAKQKETEAQEALYSSVYLFESDSTAQALKGTGGNEGLEAIAEDYSGTKAGKLASLYSGIALLNDGKFDEAIEYLKNFSSSDYLVQAKAYCLTGDAYAEKGDVNEAINFYKKAANYKPNKYYTPKYMMKLAGALEANNNAKEAIGVYSDLIDQYSNTSEAVNSKKFKAALEGQLGE